MLSCKRGLKWVVKLFCRPNASREIQFLIKREILDFCNLWHILSDGLLEQRYLVSHACSKIKKIRIIGTTSLKMSVNELWELGYQEKKVYRPTPFNMKEKTEISELPHWNVAGDSSLPNSSACWLIAFHVRVRLLRGDFI